MVETPMLGINRALAQSAATTEKDAFEAAKALGTVEAWDAFLRNYPTGFHADLARAYVKKLAEQSLPQQPVAVPSATGGYDYPMVAGTWGGVVRKGPGQDYEQIASLKEGEQVTLMAPPVSVDNGFPWFRIAYGDGHEGFMWGGIICSTGAERPDMFKLCTFTPVRSASTPSKSPQKSPASSNSSKEKSKGCSSGRIMIDGQCVKKQDAQTHCGPGYRLKGSKCVPGYRAPKPSDPVPSWQLEAIKKGCPKGMAWNKFEGCHEND
jgi:hypothetical protein